MSCQDIQSSITELARGQMLEARVKDETLAHMDSCQRCASRFANERTLSSGLRAVGASVASKEMPARIEGALLQAFRQGASASRLSSRPKSGPRWLTWSIAAAAAVLIVSALAIPHLLTNDSRPLGVERAADPQPIRGTSTEQADLATVPVDTVEDGMASLSPGTHRRPVSRSRPRMQTAALGKSSDTGNTADPSNTRSEIATDFLPLSYGSNLAQIDGGQVVRVQLPRSALQSFGLPMNTERAGERVTADVLLGHDGVARAIRFVR